MILDNPAQLLYILVDLKKGVFGKTYEVFIINLVKVELDQYGFHNCILLCTQGVTQYCSITHACSQLKMTKCISNQNFHGVGYPKWFTTTIMNYLECQKPPRKEVKPPSKNSIWPQTVKQIQSRIGDKGNQFFLAVLVLKYNFHRAWPPRKSRPYLICQRTKKMLQPPRKIVFGVKQFNFLECQ